MDFKYVIYKGFNEDGDEHEIPFLFPAIIVHKDFERFRRHEHLNMMEIISAGFCQITSTNGVKCWGRSESLNIDSRPKEDAEAILRCSAEYWGRTIVRRAERKPRV